MEKDDFFTDHEGGMVVVVDGGGGGGGRGMCVWEGGGEQCQLNKLRKTNLVFNKLNEQVGLYVFMLLSFIIKS